MAKTRLHRPELAGSTVYVVVWNDNDQAWNGAAFVAYTTTQGDFDQATTAVPATGIVSYTLPAGAAYWKWFIRSGATPDIGDLAIQAGDHEQEVTGSVGSVTGDVGGDVTGSVGSVTAPVTVGTNNDKTNYQLSAAQQAAVVAAVEAALVNDGDATPLLQAIADKFTAEYDIEDLSLATIASAVAANPSIAQMIADAATAKTAAESADGKLPSDLQTQLSDLRGEVETVDGVVDAIKTKTDALDFTGTAGALKSESTNMRGTDGANTVTPDNAGIAATQTAAQTAATTATTINTKIGTPQTTLADDIGDIQAGGVTIPVIQVPVPASRKWILKPTGDGLRGELPIVREVGDQQNFAVDFRNDLANNGRLISLDSIVVEGTENGIVIDPMDQGVDRSQAKFNIEALIAGTYVITVTASYDDSDGGGTSIGDVTLIVKA